MRDGPPSSSRTSPTVHVDNPLRQAGRVPSSSPTAGTVTLDDPIRPPGRRSPSRSTARLVHVDDGSRTTQEWSPCKRMILFLQCKSTRAPLQGPSSSSRRPPAKQCKDGRPPRQRCEAWHPGRGESNARTGLLQGKGTPHADQRPSASERRTPVFRSHGRRNQRKVIPLHSKETRSSSQEGMRATQEPVFSTAKAPSLRTKGPRPPRA
jgi:hypothetical protein